MKTFNSYKRILIKSREIFENFVILSDENIEDLFSTGMNKLGGRKIFPGGLEIRYYKGKLLSRPVEGGTLLKMSFFFEKEMSNPRTVFWFKDHSTRRQFILENKLAFCTKKAWDNLPFKSLSECDEFEFLKGYPNNIILKLKYDSKSYWYQELGIVEPSLSITIPSSPLSSQ